jgi:hypothetical protein
VWYFSTLPLLNVDYGIFAAVIIFLPAVQLVAEYQDITPLIK